MDNAHTHHARILKLLYYNINILFGAAYSPFLNPIEEFFSYLKHRLRFINKENRSQLVKGVYSVCKELPENAVFSFYKYHLDFMKRSLDKEAIY